MGRLGYARGMPGNVARLPSSPQGGDGSPTPGEIYKIAVEEYRFQAQFNWSRTQYLLVFNAGILAVAIGLTSQPLLVGSLAFVLGLVASVMTILVVRVQHSYYRAARDHMKRIEAEVQIPMTQRLDTTSTLGGRQRKVSLNQLVYLLLGVLAAANVWGLVSRLVVG